MHIAFSRSLRSLHADGRSRRAIWFLLLPVVALAAWTAWFFGARVSRYEITDQARVEMDQAVPGEKPGAIIPPGKLRVIAEFPPPAAFGRIHAGQRALVRIQGFPPAQFGALRAHVTGIGGEVRNGSVPVELAIDTSATSIPLQRGLPGAVEVQVDSVSPATLLLRAAGQLFSKSPYDRQSP